MSSHEENLSNADYNRLRKLISAESGINLSPDKKMMLELRIRRRLRGLNLNTYSEYCEYLFDGRNHRDEIVQLLDVVTTNKTDFFREPDHFDYLANRAVPDMVARNASGRPLLVWSAGCSSGEEPYTLAMVLSECLPAGLRFRVLATDISTTVLTKASRGVFKREVVAPVPEELRQKYFMRSREPGSDLMRVVPELRKLVEFRRLNFMDADFGLSDRADAIFCRNVIIYFDRPTQEQILQKLTRQLVPSGYLFMGHSESLHGMDLALTPVAAALYRKNSDAGT
ncbi:MAG: CheR family methyltransferase [Terriglobales bacterium]